ncbi:MAG: sodium/hydrogen antiporter [Mycobacterium sp.]|nr:sodium/hydrogen antiporter [Mycobacterium sp.]MDT5325227.1 sodium/hydrogen antiporter [Mycobacterium sp.]
MTTNAAFVLTLLVLCYAVVSGLVKRWYLAPALIFVLFGIILGPFGLGVIDIGTDTASFTVVAQLALTVILFNQAVQLDLSTVFRRREVTFRLLVIGIPLALTLGTVTAVLVLPVMPLWEAVCLSAIVAPTEVALIDALLEDKRVPERIRHALSTESGFYDGFALAAMLAALALASEQSDPDASRWTLFLVRTEVVSVVVGLAIGAIGGLVIARSQKREWMSDTWAQLATLAVALVCFQVGEGLHGSGFVAAFAGGLAFAFMAKRIGVPPDTQVSDAAGQLLELMVFAMFGSYAVVVGWRDAGWRVVLFAVLALFAVRMIGVGVALIRSDLPARNRLFIGWFGPRGIGTLVLGLLVVERGQIEQESLITQVVVVTVTLSLVVHSLTAWPGIKWLAARKPADAPG